MEAAGPERLMLTMRHTQQATLIQATHMGQAQSRHLDGRRRGIQYRLTPLIRVEGHHMELMDHMVAGTRWAQPAAQRRATTAVQTAPATTGLQ